ncbi:hypothetical protein CC85DRAFT_163684 [Cutaneotrichosporon oleaginosum]|uniref:Uncharacterized protein n=1 Tax=Cutaneotrichosporon oleaginosum TaxID=879819 RepID=A0A0J0XGE3_9TREE|nr:uncharacterized protein CC85DRAFT_163684 [Cutaneotrichosporon oleaginosum]KLT40131.1 hypothetical protein CC85DRAFT_163684 [Cutaneotrichosporon oleaginosum]TXT04769.1 hypothetical protein COLE_07588 [Cutaneotrichosporon oleaginosum]
MLDAAHFPHLVDLVFAHAESAALLTLRRCSRDFCTRADARLMYHIRVTSATNPWSDPEFWEYALSSPLGRPPLLRTWHDDMGRYVAHLGLWVERAANRAAERTMTAERYGSWEEALRAVRVLELVGTVVPDGVGEFTSLLSCLEVIVFTAAGEEDAADIAPFVYASAPTTVVRSAVDCGSHPSLPLPEVGDDSDCPVRLVLLVDCTPRACWRLGVSALLGIPLGTRVLVIICARTGAGGHVDEEEVGPLGLLTDMGEVLVHHLPHLQITFVDVAHAYPGSIDAKTGERQARAELHRLVDNADRNAKIDAAFPNWSMTDAHAAVDAVQFVALDAYRKSIGEGQWAKEMGD